ncbi:MAG: alpha,alpha-trehalase TreA [Hyphomicrobiales bacterium]|nr:alpha,alpha-trehalase TreA [Hyphomicrobiales bacterium]
MLHDDRRFALAVATFVFRLSLAVPAAALSPDAAAPPSVEFGELYRAVEMAGLFPDQKTFADAVPDEPPAAVMTDYEREKRLPGFDLRAFVDRHFAPPPQPFDVYRRHPDWTVSDYIRNAWEALQRKPDEAKPYSSLLPLSRPYIVPGGRFREIYYWDSYFTMLGLEQDGRRDLARDMLANIASLIDRYGHMPNGNRTYYLSRSQPPFFSCMVELVAAHDGEEALVDYLPELQAEYDYWMNGAESLSGGSAHRRVVRLPDGAALNRYWDDRAVPRDESFRQDVETALRTTRPAEDIYRELRAGAESGWDFSSRWLADGKDLATIRTTEIAPVDLNTLMMHLEETLAKAYRLKGDLGDADRYLALADNRRNAIRRLMWNASTGFFVDYLWREGRQSDALTAATVFPLFFGVATPEQFHAMAEALRQRLLEPGGLGTTVTETGQQWDRPNGWAPLQYLAIEGLAASGERGLAREIAARWVRKNVLGYSDAGVLVEKYNVELGLGQRGSGGGAGGEYALQVGFGWTNGVLAKLMAEFPELTAPALQQNP